jgi:hypothetical protein
MPVRLTGRALCCLLQKHQIFPRKVVNQAEFSAKKRGKKLLAFFVEYSHHPYSMRPWTVEIFSKE